MGKYNYSAREIIKKLNKGGFNFVRQNGSHALFRNFEKKITVIVPIHTKNVPTGTARAILKDAGLAPKSQPPSFPNNSVVQE